MFCLPFSSRDSMVFRSVATLAAMSSTLMLRFPINAWNVGLSLERTLTVRLSRLMRGPGSALDGTGSGILPLGPRIGQQLLPIDGFHGASAITQSLARVVAT